MGACSSKPKTTEFEGSMEPRKPTDVASHQPPETERSLENLADDHGKDAPVKAGGEGAHASTEAVQTTPELDVVKDEGLSTGVLSRSAEGCSEAQSDVLGEREAVHKESSDEVEQKEKKVDVVSDEVVQKDVAGGGGVADSASVNSNDADNKETSVVDEAKTCEDKAVVSEETGSNQGDAAYVDKTVSLDEEKAPETPKKRNIILPEEEEASTAEFAGVESPIIGVVQPVELMNDAMDEKDVSKIGATEAGIVGAREESLEDSKVAAESPVKGAGDVDASASATEDVQEDVLSPAREASSEGIEASSVEIVAPTSAAETLAPVSALDTRAPAEADPLKDGEEGTSQPQGEALSEAVVDISPATMDSKIDGEECSTDTKAGVPLDESVVNQNEDSHASAVKDGGSFNSLEMETPKTIENVDSEVATIELKTKDAQEESAKEKGGPILEEMDVSNGQTKAFVTEEVHEDGRPIATLGESMPEREEKDEQIQESTVEVGKHTADKPRMEHTSSGDAVFEDASDVPLKLDASKSIGSGHVPS